VEHLVRPEVKDPLEPLEAPVSRVLQELMGSLEFVAARVREAQREPLVMLDLRDPQASKDLPAYLDLQEL